MEIDKLQKLIRLEIQRDKEITHLRKLIGDSEFKLELSARRKTFVERYPDNPYALMDVLPDDVEQLYRAQIPNLKERLRVLEES